MATRVLLLEIDNGKGFTAFYASSGFTTTASDTPAHQHYDGRIKNDPTYTREVQLYIWGGGSPPRTIGDIELINDDGALDDLLDEDLRDATATLLLIEEGQAYSAATTAAVAIIDKVESVNEHTLRLVLRDKSALLDFPVANSFYSSSTPNAELEGELKPIAMGAIEYVPLIEYDAANLEYDIADAAFRDVEELRDQGVLLTKGTGWQDSLTSAVTGVKRLTNPAGKQCAKIRGQIDLTGSDVLGGIGAFTSWSGDNPTGWTVSEGLGRIVTQNASACRFLKSGTIGTCRIAKSSVMTVSQLYFYSVTVTNFTSGTVTLRDSAATTIRTLSAAGTYRGTFTAGATGIEVDAPGSTCDITIDSLVVYPCKYIETLADWIEHICEVRGPLDAAEIDYAGTIADLETAAPYTLAFYSAETTTIRSLLQQTLDSFSGAYWFDRFGVLKVGRLAAPSGTPVLELTDVELRGEINVRTDDAPALSNRMACKHNYAPHAEGEIAGSVLLTSTATKLRRENVKRAGASTLGDQYAHAVGADPIPSLLSSGTNCKTEIDRLTALFTGTRKFVSFEAMLGQTDALELEPFDVVTITTDRFGFDAGVDVLVTSVKGSFLSDRVTIEAWF